jgi:DNA repair exonuclease SbcCD ATPase subunit
MAMNFPSNDQMSPQMIYTKEQIEREERKLKQLQQKLDFETAEQTKREEQIARRQKAELDKLQITLNRQFDAYKESLERGVRHEEAKIQKLKSEQMRLRADESAARQKYEAYDKSQGEQNNRSSRPASADKEFKNSPEVIRIRNENDLLNKKLREEMNKLSSVRRESQNELAAFTRNQKRQVEKLQRQLEREKNGFDDAWQRAKKFLEDKVKMTESMVKRLQADFETELREFKIVQAREEKRESEQRARFGDEKANENFTTVDEDDMTPEKVTENFAKAKERHRMGGARW